MALHVNRDIGDTVQEKTLYKERKEVHNRQVTSINRGPDRRQDEGRGNTIVDGVALSVDGQVRVARQGWYVKGGNG